jgi:hypothetical protein
MSEADHEATLREQISADAAAGAAERAVFDSTSSEGTAPGSEPTAAEQQYKTPLDLSDPLPSEPELPGAQVGTVSRNRTPQLLAGGGLVAVVLFVLWRLKLRRTPPTPSERLAESAKAVGAASVAAGTRAVGKLSENAAPAAERAAELAKRGVQTSSVTAQRAATAAKPAVAAAAAVAAREGAKVGSKAVENAGDIAAKAGDVAAKATGVAALAAQSATSTLSDVGESIGDVSHSVHKSYRKWTFRLWFGTFAAIGYVLGARAGRERYDQIASLAGKVAQQPPVQQAKSKVSGAL